MSDATTTENPDYALATDLDGTLIPLPDEPLHRWACARLKFLLGRDHIPFMFATGRHFESAHAAIAQYGLPVPQWIVCNVGTDVYERRADGSYKRMEAFHEHLHAFAKGVTTEDVYAAVKDVDGIVLQPQDVQGPFKLSFFADPEKLESLSAELTERVQAKSLQYEVMTSVDPGKSHGLIDLLPNDVHKAHAVMWLADHVGFSPDHVIYAGDSGNDYAALTHGFRAIVVGNASPGLAEKVKTALNEAARLECFYEAEFGATAAVLEGCLNYELFNGEAEALKGFGSRKPAEWHSPIGVSCSSTEVLCNIWAPKCDAECFLKFVEGTEPESEQALVRSDNGYHFKDLKASLGTTYHIELSDGRRLPDPASRFQPEGVQGPSQIVPLPRHSSREWSQAALPKSLWELVIYEVHVGTFTYEGTYAAAAKRLPKLKELGVTAIELMPLAQPSGSRNWGYDGVFLYAPQAAYGTPAELGAFIDEAHRLGLLVIHDVVYNHLGPEGNVLDEFGPYHRDDIQTPWGPALDWTQPAVRDFFLCNALYWLGEVGFDGLRLDAIGTYYDDTAPCFLDELREVVDALGKAQGRKLWLFGESNLYHARNLSARPEGSDLDAIWSDDLAHSLFSVITDQTEHGGRSYRGAADLDQALKRGALFERTGQDQSQRLPDLSPALPCERFIVGVQNHDWVGNHPQGLRLPQRTSRETHLAASALVLLYPAIPLLFMGEEYNESSPFLFFTDFGGESLRQAVDEGRRREHPQHDWSQAILASSEEAFLQSKLRDFDGGDAGMLAWYTALLSLRREGIAAGWLRADNLTVTADQRNHDFHLHYWRGEAAPVTVSVWLRPESDVSLEDPPRKIHLHSAEERFSGGGKIPTKGPWAAVLS